MIERLRMAIGTPIGGGACPGAFWHRRITAD